MELRATPARSFSLRQRCDLALRQRNWPANQRYGLHWRTASAETKKCGWSAWLRLGSRSRTGAALRTYPAV